MLQNEEQIPVKTVTETSTELLPSLGNYEPISEIRDTKPSSDSLSTESGQSKFWLKTLTRYISCVML